jgi:hypothetical protein
MTHPKLPADVRGFIQACIPDVDAAELLLFVARERAHALTLRKLAAKLKHAELDELAVERYLAGFIQCGLIEREEHAYRFAAAASEYDAILAELGRLYNEQPVTLVRMIYAPKDDRLHAFAEAFKIKR